MKKSINRLTSVILLSSLFISSNIYAKSFSDVSKNGNYDWAYNSIEQLYGKKILGGYPNGSFKPQRPVSFLEIMQIIKNIKNPSESEIKNAKHKYLNICKKYRVAPWAEDAVCYNLNNNTITEKTLNAASEKGFLREKNIVYPDRNSVTVYFGRAFGFSGNGNVNVLKHKDVNSIPAMTKGFLAELVENNIYSKTGSDGYFNGKNFIRRAEVAVIADKAMKYLKNEHLDNKDENIDNSQNNVLNINGKVDFITLSGELSTISINSKTYKIAFNNVKIIDKTGSYNGDVLTLKNAVVNAEIQNKIVKTIEILELENINVEKDQVIIEEPKKDTSDVNISGRVIDSIDYNGKYEIEIFIYESNNSNYIAGETLKIMSDKNYGKNETVILKGQIINNHVENLEIME